MFTCLEYLADMVPVMVAHDRCEALAEAALLRPHSRWSDAILAGARGRHPEAAAIYGTIGALPNRAAAQLLAGRGGDRDHLMSALAFYRSVRAVLYLDQTHALMHAGLSF